MIHCRRGIPIILMILRCSRSSNHIGRVQRQRRKRPLASTPRRQGLFLQTTMSTTISTTIATMPPAIPIHNPCPRLVILHILPQPTLRRLILP